MSETTTKSVAADTLRAISQTVPSTKTHGPRLANDKLLLSSEYRVSSRDVFVLKPEHAVQHPRAAQGQASHLRRVPDTQRTPTAASKRPLLTASTAEPKAKTSDVKDLTAKIAALELAIAKTVDQWEPDGAGRDPYAGTQGSAMAWKDNVELDATGRPLGEATEDAFDTSGRPNQARSADASAVLQSIDEAMLREIVADIVRSELQGALGERITRNVRKLVRGEIQRELAARALD